MCIIHYHFNINLYFVFKSCFLLNKYINFIFFVIIIWKLVYRKPFLNYQENIIFKLSRKPYFQISRKPFYRYLEHPLFRNTENPQKGFLV